MSKTTLLPPELGGIVDWLLARLRPRLEHEFNCRCEIALPHASTRSGRTHSRYNADDPPHVRATTSCRQLHVQCTITCQGGEADGHEVVLFGDGPYVIGENGQLVLQFFVAIIMDRTIVLDCFPAGTGS